MDFKLPSAGSEAISSIYLVWDKKKLSLLFCSKFIFVSPLYFPFFLSKHEFYYYTHLQWISRGITPTILYFEDYYWRRLQVLQVNCGDLTRRHIKSLPYTTNAHSSWIQYYFDFERCKCFFSVPYVLLALMMIHSDNHK